MAAFCSDRAYCLVALLAQFSKLDKVRSWQLMSETVKSANAVADFTGDNGRTSQLLEGKFSINMTTELATPAALTDLFTGLAEEIFTRRWMRPEHSLVRRPGRW